MKGRRHSGTKIPGSRQKLSAVLIDIEYRTVPAGVHRQAGAGVPHPWGNPPSGGMAFNEEAFGDSFRSLDRMHRMQLQA